METTLPSVVLSIPLAIAEAIGAHPHEAEAVASFAWLLPVLPLVGFTLLIFFGGRLRRLFGGSVTGWVGTGMVTASFALALAILLQLLSIHEEEARSMIVPLYTWIDVGGLHLTTDLLIDPLSMTMVLVVTGVGAVIHVYSIGYMHGDERQPRFFAYMNLFIFSMLVLVLAADLVVLFVGWELVGLCSYLLIGFWFTDRSNAVAAKKALIVNRVGDVSFAIGLFVIFAAFGTLAFPEIASAADDVLKGREGLAVAIGLLLLGGAVGKSAQIPLFVWLPDAMAGPTPVSALIHAATMVTAGVYMVARLSPIYVQAPFALDIVAWVGVLTALLAAVIAIQQDDIKRVLAYSTISQLGYMFVGVGVGAFGSGIFHLVTHAFFKALLFLVAGSVMHAMAERGDMWRMGGLRTAMPITFGTGVVATLAISGIVPFAGFFSKDHILSAAYHHHKYGIWAIALLTAGITGFYMGRWLVVPFFGRRRYDPSEVEPHESPPTMTFSMLVLAFGSVIAGFLNPSPSGPFEHWLEKSFAHLPPPEPSGGLPEPVLIGLSLLVSIVGLALAGVVYARDPERDPVIELGPVARLMRRDFLVDDLYELVFVRLGAAWSRALAWFDDKVVDGAVNGLGRLTATASVAVKRAQVGLVRAYVAGLFLGTVALVAAFLVQVS
ncbi:MAG: NADH-quinone oxidoreductase subunit L [Actinomycetota bacterium]|nr:NADH-quinone oxidoreductase subunit L [Actinomycetota bacterium]